ncbi:MAG: hypothetical protein WCK32_08800 [Chlorobiaceae bacterium]
MIKYQASEHAIKDILIQAANQVLIRLPDDKAFESLQKRYDFFLTRTTDEKIRTEIERGREKEKQELKKEKELSSYGDFASALTNNSLQTLLSVIDREGLRDFISDGLSSLAARFNSDNQGFVERMSQEGFMGQLHKDYDDWGSREGEYKSAIYWLDIQYTAKWLSGEYVPKSHAIAEQPSSRSAIPVVKARGRKVKLSMETFKNEIYPEMKKKFPDAKHVDGKKAYCETIGKKYGVSEKTIRDKFDMCNMEK